MSTITRVVRTGQAYSESPSLLIDGNPATVADLVVPANAAPPDFFRLDLGAATVISAVDLVNVYTPVVVQGQAITASLYAANDPTLGPGDAGTVLIASTHIGANMSVYPQQGPNTGVLSYPAGTALGATPYRYVLLAYTADQGESQQVQTGEIIVNPQQADTTPPVPLSAGVNAAGTGGTLLWTEAGSPPVLQAAGMGAAQGLTLTASGGPVTLTAVTTAGTTTSFTTSRAVAQGEALTLAGTTGAFTDSATPPNPTAAFAGLAVANGSAQAPVVSAQRHLFSTGILVANWDDAGGNPQAATFATLQDISLDIGFSRTDLYDAAQISLFPADTADSEGRMTLKAGNASISADTLQRLIAASLSGTLGGPGTVTATLPKAVALPYFRAVFTGMSSDGRTVVVTAGQARAKGRSLSGKVKDFWTQSFELDCYPDAEGVVATFQFEN